MPTINRGFLPLALVALSSAEVVKYTFDLRDWIVDYMKPTVGDDRLTPYEMSPEVRKSAQLVNGQYPGPLIECFENDTLEITVLNNLGASSTTIHWHGLHVPGTPYYDGPTMIAQAPILPGENFTYTFKAYPAGTHYWHSHMDALQKDRGVKGPIVVHPREDPFAHLYDEEKIIVFSDEWQNPEVCLKLEGALEGNPVCAEIDKASINGRYGNGTKEYPYSLIEVEEGKCYRLRFVNMGGNAQNYITQIAGHNTTLLSLDGYDVKPIPINSFNIHVGERYDMVLCADQKPGNYLMNLTYDLACPLMPGNYIPPGMAEVESCYFYGFIHYKGHDEIPTEPKGTGGGADPQPADGVYFNLNEASAWEYTQPAVPQEQPEKADWYITLNMGVSGDISYNAGTTPLTTGRWYMSDASQAPEPWTMPVTPLLHTKGKCGAEKTPFYDIPEDAKVVEVRINNLAPTAHVLHLHGMYFEVINYANFSWCNNQDPYDISCFNVPYIASKCPKEDRVRANPDHPEMGVGLWWGCAYNETKDSPRQNLKTPLRKDMISVWRRSWAVIRLRPVNPGVWLFHCHMAQHVPIGMITAFNVLPSQQPPIPMSIPTAGPCPVWSDNVTMRHG